MTKLEGGIHIFRDKRLLDGKLLRSGLHNNLADPVIDLLEFVHKDLPLRPDAPRTDIAELERTYQIDDTVTGNPGSRIYTQNNQTASRNF